MPVARKLQVEAAKPVLKSTPPSPAPAPTEDAESAIPAPAAEQPWLPPLNAKYEDAELRPGLLLLIEFSRPGGVKYQREEGARRNQRVVTDNPALEKMSSKVVNTAYAKLVARFAHTPWGFFCEKDADAEEAFELLTDCRAGAMLANLYAEEINSPRRVRIDIYDIPWNHKKPAFRQRVGEMIAHKLIDLRGVYTSSRMWEYRVKMDRVRNMERLVLGAQHELVAKALAATETQRKTMVAIYGDKVPRSMLDADGNLKTSVKLNFGPIDRAISAFYPDWDPPQTQS